MSFFKIIPKLFTLLTSRASKMCFRCQMESSSIKLPEVSVINLDRKRHHQSKAKNVFNKNILLSPLH